MGFGDEVVRIGNAQRLRLEDLNVLVVDNPKICQGTLTKRHSASYSGLVRLTQNYFQFVPKMQNLYKT